MVHHHPAQHTKRLQTGEGDGNINYGGKSGLAARGVVPRNVLQVFLDVQKSYYSLDIGRCMDILRGHGLIPKLQRLLQCFWDEQAVVTKAGKFSGRLFGSERGVTQGEPVSPTIFNIVVDEVVSAVMLEV